jgi:hypothetical protein
MLRRNQLTYVVQLKTGLKVMMHGKQLLAFAFFHLPEGKLSRFRGSHRSQRSRRTVRA